MRHVAGTVLGVVLSVVAGLHGCGASISPKEAYEMELAQCSRASNVAGCMHMVELKYQNYNKNGAYPTGQTPGPSR